MLAVSDGDCAAAAGVQSVQFIVQGIRIGALAVQPAIDASGG
jgi:hypothetical protein